MVKTIVSTIVAVLIFVAGAVAEQIVLQKNFDEFRSALEIIETKISDSEATRDDVANLEETWLKEKNILHTMIPHTEIKEFDLWIAETYIYVEKKDFDEALAKITVLKHLADEIPKPFEIKAINLF